MSSKPNWVAIIAGVVAAAAAAIALSVASTSGGSGQPGGPGSGAGQAGGRPHGRAAFAWFRARPAPAGWRRAALPGGGAVLAYPASLGVLSGDRGSVTRGLSRRGAVLVYLNVTPRQGAETLRGWAGFRLDHVRDDDARSAQLDSEATGLAFRGGTGSCVIDDYITKARAHHYREIACYVQGAHAASVLVAATPAADWGRYAGLLEETVNNYAVT